MKASNPRSVRVIVPLLCGVALLPLAATTRAQIALVDNELTTASIFFSTSTALLLTTNLTVSPSANTLLVVVTFRNASNISEAPTTLNWTNATTTNTLTLIVQKASKATTGRASAIYYCYNPTSGFGYNISGKLSGQSGAGGGSSSSGALVAYIEGVDTNIAHRTVIELWNTWDWNNSNAWGWDFPWMAMAAARIGETQIAVDALMDDSPENQYDNRGVCNGWYLPGNGGLLYAVAMMAAGWDGSSGRAPGFSSAGSWTVKWEGLNTAP
jgi:hypothetical protein